MNSCLQPGQFSSQKSWNVQVIWYKLLILGIANNISNILNIGYPLQFSVNIFSHFYPVN